MDCFYGIQANCCIPPGNDNPITTPGFSDFLIYGPMQFRMQQTTLMCPSFHSYTHTHTHWVYSQIFLLGEIRLTIGPLGVTDDAWAALLGCWHLGAVKWGHTHTETEQMLLQLTYIDVCMYVNVPLRSWKTTAWDRRWATRRSRWQQRWPDCVACSSAVAAVS